MLERNMISIAAHDDI